jgi:hypothetical protein
VGDALQLEPDTPVHVLREPYLDPADIAGELPSGGEAVRWVAALDRAARRGKGRQVIFSEIRDLRLVTVRRGGTLLDSDHRLLAVWAADCAQHVLRFFEDAQPGDDRPRRAIELARAWARGEITMTEAPSRGRPRRPSWWAPRAAAGHANAAARDVLGAAKEAAHAAGQAGAVAHVAAHELGSAAYAIRAARAAAHDGEREKAGRLECLWQRAQLPSQIRELVLDDQRLRNEYCWSVFDC